MSRYTRHPLNTHVLLVDPKTAEDFRAKKNAEQEVESLKSEINTLKAELQEIRSLLNTRKSN
jgi:cell shape-determining protein MreC